MGFLRIILQGEPKENVVMGIEDQKWIHVPPDLASLTSGNF